MERERKRGDVIRGEGQRHSLMWRHSCRTDSVSTWSQGDLDETNGLLPCSLSFFASLTNESFNWPRQSDKLQLAAKKIQTNQQKENMAQKLAFMKVCAICYLTTIMKWVAKQQNKKTKYQTFLFYIYLNISWPYLPYLNLTNPDVLKQEQKKELTKWRLDS